MRLIFFQVAILTFSSISFASSRKPASLEFKNCGTEVTTTILGNCVGDSSKHGGVNCEKVIRIHHGSAKISLTFKDAQTIDNMGQLYYRSKKGRDVKSDLYCQDSKDANVNGGEGFYCETKDDITERFKKIGIVISKQINGATLFSESGGVLGDVDLNSCAK